MQSFGQRLIKCLKHQRGFAAAGHPGDAGEGAEREGGIDLLQIESVFQGTVMVLPDPDHSAGEQRFRAIGKTNIQPAEANRYVFVVFTLRKHNGQTFIRPISARYMHRKEIDHYEKENPNL
jgi:hypothetical protein